MSDLNVNTISNSNIAKTDKLLAFNNSDSKAATIQDVVQLVPGVMAVATCSTAGNVATKAVTCDDWNNKPGQSILVEFSNANSADNVTLSINNGTAIPVYYMTTATEQVSGGAIPAGAVVFTLNAAGNKFYAHVTKLIEGAGVKIDGSKIEAVNDLPTDAVLHYSFDDLPDYPDGTAVYKKDNDWVNADGWNSDNNNTTFSVSNGIAKWTAIDTNKVQLAKTIIGASGKIFRIKFRCSVQNINVTLLGRDDSSFPVLTSITYNTGWAELIGFIPSNYTNYLVLLFYTSTIGATVEISQIYIGDGSYSTPVIDNANGKWNSVSQSGVAVQGVSGKAIRFLGNNYIKGNLPWKPHDKKVFTVSGWFKNWDKTTNLHFISDWITSAVANFMIELDPTDTISLAFDVPTDDGCKRFGVNKTILNWNNYSGDVFLTGVFNGDNSKFYVNGINFPLTLRTTVSLSDTIKSRDVFEIGRLYGSAGGSNCSIVTIDDLLIFDRALTEKEVVALYNNKANTPKYFSKADYLLEQIANNS